MTIPIIDAHHHIWRQQDLPWLVGPMLPRIFGPYEPIRRDYPIEEYLADIADTGVEKSVYVQANWAPERAEDEVAWVQATADETRLAARHRRLCRPHGRRRAPGARPAGAVSAHARRAHAAPLARKPDYRFAAAPGPRRRSDLPAEFRGARRLRLHLRPAGFLGRRWKPPRGLPRISRRPPSSCSMPACWRIFRRPAAIAWREGMRKLAAQPNVVSKLSGLGTFIHRNDPDHIDLDRQRDGRPVRRRALPVRLQLPDREAVDALRKAHQCLSRRARAVSGGRSSAPCSMTLRRGFTASRSPASSAA